MKNSRGGSSSMYWERIKVPVSVCVCVCACVCACVCVCGGGLITRLVPTVSQTNIFSFDNTLI